jgi:hypothetical protein
MSSLAFLSIQRVGFRKVPHVPSNTERLQAYRRFLPVQFANDLLPRREARNQAAPVGVVK